MKEKTKKHGWEEETLYYIKYKINFLLLTYAKYTDFIIFKCDLRLLWKEFPISPGLQDFDLDLSELGLKVYITTMFTGLKNWHKKNLLFIY